MSSLINLIDKYHTQLTVLLIGLAVIILTVTVWVWFYNRKKYHNLKHQIPASVVKNYLDSIIQNSTSLKSSLFRGGGLDGDAIPSVFPLTDLQSGAQISVDTGDVKELKALIDKLQNQLAEKNNIIRDLENQNVELHSDVRVKDERIIELEGLLKQARSGSDDGKALANLEATNKVLKDELAQFEMIADDLADLKELKKENAMLRALLAEKGIEIPKTEAKEAPAPVQAVEEEVGEESFGSDQETDKVEETVGGSESEEGNEVSMGSDGPEEADITQMIEDGVSEAKGEAPEEVAASPEEIDSESEENETPEKVEAKSPEDLLEEFEKMLS